eukprot:Opistho-2@52295
MGASFDSPKKSTSVLASMSRFMKRSAARLNPTRSFSSVVLRRVATRSSSSMSASAPVATIGLWCILMRYSAHFVHSSTSRPARSHSATRGSSRDTYPNGSTSNASSISAALMRRSTCNRYADPLSVREAVSSGCGTGGLGTMAFVFVDAATRSASSHARACSAAFKSSSSQTSIASMSSSPAFSVSAVRFVAGATSASPLRCCCSASPSFAKSASNCSSRSLSRSSSGNSISSDLSHTRMERSCDPLATKSPDGATARHHASPKCVDSSVEMCSKLSPSQYLTRPSFAAVKKWCVSRKNRTDMMPSSCANIDLWQSPKSRPHIFTFLSADAVTSRALSELMSMDVTGNLCPYIDRKNRSVSSTNTLTVLSSSETQTSFPLGL